MDLQRKTLGQLMAGVFGIGNKSKAVKVDAAELDADDSQEDEQDAADDADESEEEVETEADDDAEQEEAPKKKATAPTKTTSAAGTVTLKLADYNALQAEAGQAKTLKAANVALKTKASAWDAHQKAVGGVAPKADTTNDAPETEENDEMKEQKRLEARYGSIMPK